MPAEDACLEHVAVLVDDRFNYNRSADMRLTCENRIFQLRGVDHSGAVTAPPTRTGFFGPSATGRGAAGTGASTFSRPLMEPPAIPAGKPPTTPAIAWSGGGMASSVVAAIFLGTKDGAVSSADACVVSSRIAAAKTSLSEEVLWRQYNFSTPAPLRMDLRRPNKERSG